MVRLLLIKLLSVSALLVAIKAAVLTGKPLKPGIKPLISARSLYEQYTLGQEVDGANILFMYQDTQSYDDLQSEISLDFNYPNSTSDDKSVVITQVKLYVEASDAANTQAYLTEGGIDQRNVSLTVVANNSSLLRYMLVIYGKQE